MNDSERIDEIVASLDLIASRVELISTAVSELEARAAVMSDDLTAIRRDIDQLQPGVI